jgi:regulator of CtrA degradation
MMHAVAWLLNHRAYFMGELSEFQLRRYGRLAPDFPAADPDRMALLSPKIRTLIAATENSMHACCASTAAGAKPRPARRAPLTNCARLASAVA